MNPRAGTLLDRDLVARISPSSLLFYSGNVHSQFGQDGILAEIFRRTGIATGYFVEFGAWDGIHLSNCRFLYEKGWRGLFIEANPARFAELQAVYRDSSDVALMNAIVGAPRLRVSGKPLSTLLEEGRIEASAVTFVSIDVDGPDLEIFLELGFRPPVILIEGGFNFSPFLTKQISPQIAWRNIQQPLAVIVAAAKSRGYTPVCFYQDTYLVRDDLVGSNGKDAATLYADAWNFATFGHRQFLLSRRADNPVIRQIEEEFFGRFCPNPLDYA